MCLCVVIYNSSLENILSIHLEYSSFQISEQQSEILHENMQNWKHIYLFYGLLFL